MLEAYSAGVNAGLGDLASAPFEYLLLRSQPVPWTAEDTVLTTFSMYLTLQQPHGSSERLRANAIEALGQEIAEFLLPEGTPWDAPLDGSSLPTSELPGGFFRKAAAPRPNAETFVDLIELGSNAFAVAGTLTSGRAAIVANDMHLGLRVPNIWYRVRLMVQGSDEHALDITGITLPGTPTVVAGSNGRVAWGFTNSYVDTSDVVVLEPVDGKADRYITREGAKELSRVEERLCQACSQSEVLLTAGARL
jgi:penicillin amidase